MHTVIEKKENTAAQTRVKELYELYSKKLLAFTKRNYNINEDDRVDLVYRTLYKMAEVHDQYKFENEQKQNAFVFKMHINFLRNYFRDNKNFEHKNREVELNDIVSVETETSEVQHPKVILLQQLLARLEDWERILLLMRSQDSPYSEISKFVNKPEKQLKVYYKRLKKKLLENMNRELNKKNNGH